MYLWISGGMMRFPWADYLSYPFTWLIGPLYLFYVRRVLDPEDRPRPRDLLHALPAVLFTLRTIPWWLTPLEQKMPIYEAVASGRDLELGAETIATYAIHGIQNFVYAYWIHRTLRRRAATVRDRLSDHAIALALRSLRRINLGLWILAGSYTILYVSYGFAGGRWAYLVDVLWMIGIAAFLQLHAYAAIVRPESFSTALRRESPEEAPAAPEASNGGKYERSSLGQGREDRIRDRLLRWMEEERPYLDGGLALRTVADRLDVTPHHLSQVLNGTLGKSFHDFVNEFRVEEAKRRLRDPAQAGRSVLEIAFESGFNTKSAFYDVFRRQTGTTPTAYRKRTDDA